MGSRCQSGSSLGEISESLSFSALEYALPDWGWNLVSMSTSFVWSDPIQSPNPLIEG